MPEPTEPKRRNAASTREAILAAARQAFARSGYDGAGVREIAAGAGVTAMLVNRYFGSKEGLFEEVVEQTMTSGSVIAGGVMGSPTPARELAEAMVRLTKPDETPIDGFLIMLHSASSGRAAQIGRAQIEKHHLKTVTDALSGELAGERAALILSLIAGFQVMRQMIGLGVLADAREDDLVELLSRLFDQLIEDGESAR